MRKAPTTLVIIVHIRVSVYVGMCVCVCAHVCMFVYVYASMTYLISASRIGKTTARHTCTEILKYSNLKNVRTFSKFENFGQNKFSYSNILESTSVVNYFSLHIARALRYECTLYTSS